MILRLFNSISVISGNMVGDNGRLCTMELRLRLKRSSPKAEPEPRTARSSGQRLTHELPGLPDSIEQNVSVV